jgi:hypothetical protein
LHETFINLGVSIVSHSMQFVVKSGHVRMLGFKLQPIPLCSATYL